MIRLMHVSIKILDSHQAELKFVDENGKLYYTVINTHDFSIKTLEAGKQFLAAAQDPPEDLK